MSIDVEEEEIPEIKFNGEDIGDFVTAEMEYSFLSKICQKGLS